jgi:oligopeptide transport system substrate-binding protein
VRRQRRGLKLLALIMGLSLAAAACGGDSGSDNNNQAQGSGEKPQQGGTLIEGGTFVGDPPSNLDPALNQELDAYQVVNALYDGLTDVDISNPDKPVTKPMVAEKYTSNDDATEWTFTIRKGLKFSNGEEILPSSFQRAWERASNPDLAGPYSYLFNFIKGGKEKLDGKADKLAGVTVDDDAMTLKVDMAAPYANFPTVSGFQIFFPMPKEVDSLKDQTSWDKGLMIGNGPFKLEKPRSDTEIDLVPNPEWDGTKYEGFDLPKQPYLDKIQFKVSADPDTSFNAFEAGETDSGQIAAGRFKDADQFGNTKKVDILGSYYWDINEDNPELGGEKNLLLRKAIMQAVDRDTINKSVYENSRVPSNQVTMPGLPGYKADLCDYCKYDPTQAKKDFDEWKAAGNKLTKPIDLQFNTGQNHDQVAAIVQDNLKAIGIASKPAPIDQENYFDQLSDGACVMCRAGWYADYPTYDNFMYDLFHSDSAHGGNNYSNYSNPEFDKLVDEAKATTDTDKAAELYQEAETKLLQDAAVIPIVWYRGDYVFNKDKVGNFTQSSLGLIPFETVFIKS